MLPPIGKCYEKKTAAHVIKKKLEISNVIKLACACIVVEKPRLRSGRDELSWPVALISHGSRDVSVSVTSSLTESAHL